ncbi:MAG: hypothetical protein KDD38_07580, partial [Bdellovibrionales bacterium]|nr:hypothetical protein [Bdellovibrionales bacterium]
MHILLLVAFVSRQKGLIIGLFLTIFIVGLGCDQMAWAAGAAEGLSCRELLSSSRLEGGAAVTQAATAMAQIDEIETNILNISDDDMADPIFKMRLMRFGSRCLETQDCVESPAVRNFLATIAPSNFSSLSADSKSMLNEFSKMCLRHGRLRCDDWLLNRIISFVQVCLNGCDEATARRIGGYLSPLGRLRLPEKMVVGVATPIKKPQEALGEEISYTKVIEEQNQLAKGLHRMSEDHLVISLDPIHHASHRGMRPSEFISYFYKQMYENEIRQYLTATELTQLLKSEGLSKFRTPDLYISGHIYDVYQPNQFPNLALNILKNVIKKVEYFRQTNRVLVDATSVTRAKKNEPRAIKSQLRSAHKVLLDFSQDGKKIEHAYEVQASKVHVKSGQSKTEAVVEYIENKLTVVDHAFRAGEYAIDFDRIKIVNKTNSAGFSSEVYIVPVASQLGIRYLQEVTVVLGTREKPVTVQIYPFFDESAIDKA